MSWMDEAEARWPLTALGKRHDGSPEPGTFTGDLHRTIRALREAETALERIRKRAARALSPKFEVTHDDMDYIEMTANEALGFIARGGDEQACSTCGGTGTSPVHIGDGRIENRPCPTCSPTAEKTK